MSLFLVVVAIVLAAGLVWVGAAVVRGRSVPEVLEQGFEEPVPGLPPILLPESPTAADVDRIRFSLGFRGYRMDQVDDVLQRLRDRIAEQDLEIARLRECAESEVEAPE